MPDANLLLTLLSAKGSGGKLPSSYENYLKITRREVGIHWYERKQFIPVNPAYAAMELSQKGERAFSRLKFERYFYDYYEKIHGMHEVPNVWVSEFFGPAVAHLGPMLKSLSSTVEKALSLIPPGDSVPGLQIESACEEFFEWLQSNRSELLVIGGPLLYASVYAIAGSPDARKLLKVAEARKGDPSQVAWNVAWDFTYLHHMDLMHAYKKYEHNVFCTADTSLANLMASRVHTGPRYEPAEFANLDFVELGGLVEPFKFKKLEQTKLSRRILDRFYALMSRISGHEVPRYLDG